MSRIRWCISTASFSVLINGSPKGFSRSSRGLRQCDPLSPYLFVLGMEVVSVGFLIGYRITNRNNEVMHIIHLLFVNNTLVFCRDSMEEMVHLSWLLLWFEVISRLKINLEKSLVLAVGDVENLDELALELGCKTGPYQQPTCVFLWECAITLFQFGIGCKRDLEKSLPFGRDELYQEEGLLLYEAHCQTCLFTLCPSSICLRQ